MPHRRLVALFAALFLSIGVAAFSQQPDALYRYDNRTPAYPAGKGPAVCIDEGHSNMHTLGGTYAPLATLLRGDGYQVQASSAFTKEVLGGCLLEGPWCWGKHPLAPLRSGVRNASRPA